MPTRDRDAIEPRLTVCARLERLLQAHESIVDCAVLERSTTAGARELVAYIVVGGAFSEAALLSCVDAAALPRPAQFAVVSAIPTTVDGQVDAAALFRLPLIDGALVERWEASVAAVGGVSRAAALLDPRRKRALPLHLPTLLPRVDSTASAPVRGVVDATPTSSPKTRRPAIVDGGPLYMPPTAPTTLAEALDRAAAASRRDVVYIAPDGSVESQSYPQLLDDAERVLGGLQARGVRPSDRVVLQLEQHRDFIVAFWACVLGGFVPVPLASSASEDRSTAALETLVRAWELLGRPHVVTSAARASSVSAHAARAGLLGVRVHAIDGLRVNVRGRRHRSYDEDLALLMLTSGSTGAPKAVRLTHRNLLSRTAASRQLNGFSDRDVTVNWMPLDHVAGLIYFHIRDVYVGCRQVHVPTATVLQNPLVWIDTLNHFRASITFAPNFAFGLVNDREQEIARRAWDLSELAYVLNGAEAIVPKTARKFLRLLAPHGLRASAMRPAWGMSETSSGVIYGDTFSLATTSDDDAFAEVGRPVPGCSVRIVDASDRFVAEGEVGRLQVRGLSITSGYLGDPELTQSSFTADRWFITGDLGFIRDGRVTITGREKDVVVVNGVNHYCHVIESAVEELEGVVTSLVAAVPVRRGSAETDQLAIFFHAADERSLAAMIGRIRGAVATKIGVTPDYVLPVAADAIPKTSLGKIQRAELSRRFAAGDFDDVLERVDRVLENANTVPDWFFRKVWRRRHRFPDPARLGASSTAVIFGRDENLAAAVRATLEARNVRCRTVRAGSQFCANGNGYTIDPRVRSHYDQLFSHASSEIGCPTHIVHLWQHGPYAGEAAGDAIAAAQYEGALSAMWIAQAIERIGPPPHPVTLTVVASHAEAVVPEEAVAYEKAPAVGLLKSLPQELAWLSCKHVDFDAGDPGATAAAIVDEICCGAIDREVAFRGGNRFVAGLEKVVFEPDARREMPFRRGGAYLVTGGAGGLGLRLAAALAERFEAALLLTGRTELDAARADAIKELCRRGSRVEHVAVDVCDEAAMTRTVEDFVRRIGRPLDGAIHLAGTYDERPAVDETAERLLATLAPKAAGADVLHRVLARYGSGLLIHWSSIAGFFGGATVGAYAAANAFQDAYAAHYRGRNGIRHVHLAWSNWTDLGQSRTHQMKEATRARGYAAISERQGIDSLMLCLACSQPAVLVGLDGDHRHIRRYLGEAADGADTLVVCYEGAPPAEIANAVGALDVRDRFGARSTVDLLRLPALPTTCAGGIDKERLARLIRSGASNEAKSPATDTERRLAQLWTRALGVGAANATDNFFDLGGDSLRAARVVGLVRDAFGCELPLRAIFDTANLAELAAAIDAAAGNALPATSAVVDRPLSSGQRALWFLHRLAPTSAAYNIAFTARILSAVDVGALRRAFQQLVDRHAALRSSFPDVRGEPRQHVDPQVPVPFEVDDVGGWTEDRILAAVAAEIARPFDLAMGPMLRVRLFSRKDGPSALAFTCHHIVMDGWSLWVALSELAELYRAAVHREPPSLPPVADELDLLAQAEQDALVGARGQRHAAYWRQRFSTPPAMLNLPTDRPRPGARAYRGASEMFRIGRDIADRLKQIGRDTRSTPQMTLLALLEVLLHRYTSQTDLTVGYLASGRTRPELESVVGYAANLLPVRLSISPADTFRAVVTDTRNTLLEALDHQEYPFLHVVDHSLASRDASRSPLFQVLFVYEKPQLLDGENAAAFIAAQAGARMNLGDLELESTSFPIQQEGQFDLTMMAVEVDGEFCVTLDYDADLFEAATIRRMGRHLEVLAESAARTPDAPIATVRLLTADEQRQLHAWNDVHAPHGSGCVHELIDRAASANPNARAVVCGGRSITYEELTRRANQLARHLRTLGVTRDAVVALLVDRDSFDLPVCLLAVLKAGGAFLVLDPTLPADRLQFMLADSGAALLVAHAALVDRAAASPVARIVLERDVPAAGPETATDVVPVGRPEDLAYVIYTSGSTGRPKGVMLEHRGLWNVALEQQRLFEPRPGDRVLQFAALGFDAAVFDVVMALCSGASLHLADRNAILPGLPLLNLLKSEEITVLTIPPSALANLPVDPLPALRVLLVAGEPCPADLVDRWARGRLFYNLYGPTEATIWATYARCSVGDRPPPIGMPIANTQAYVLDGRLQEAPIGVPGELCLGGVGVARGYVRQPESSGPSFVPNPFARDAAGRLYRTGDIVRRSADGQLHYLGRVDSQIKLRGFRIEPGEIEAALRAHETVGQAAVVVREDTAGDRRLVAYVVARGPARPSADALRTFLRAQLPEFMVPSAFVCIDAFPVNANGKIDRTAFPAPPAPSTDRPRLAPSSGLEQLIAGVWKDVLEVDSFGAEDNFFDIGGNSLRAAQVHARLTETGAAPVSIVDLFRFPTIRALAKHLDRQPVGAVEAAAAAPRGALGGPSRLREQAQRRLGGDASRSRDRLL